MKTEIHFSDLIVECDKTISKTSVKSNHFFDTKKRIWFPAMLYFLGIGSIIIWLISLVFLNVDDIFQFFIGALVLRLNILIFKRIKFKTNVNNHD